jgi:putative alpha-1,2-mannosidase
VPQDTAKLVELQGGPEKFVSRLNFIFEQNYFDSTDEPSQQIPFMYHYANRPGWSTQKSRQIVSEFFNISANGLPGNDDSGAMGSYVAFYLAGLYPLPATDQFLLSSPYFPQISFFNPAFNKTIIKTVGFQGNPHNGTGNVFVEKVKVNGKPYKSNCYLEWNIFKHASVIELHLTNNINVTCGSGPYALPPSLSTGGYDHHEPDTITDYTEDWDPEGLISGIRSFFIYEDVVAILGFFFVASVLVFFYSTVHQNFKTSEHAYTSVALHDM